MPIICTQGYNLVLYPGSYSSILLSRITITARFSSPNNSNLNALASFATSFTLNTSSKNTIIPVVAIIETTGVLNLPSFENDGCTSLSLAMASGNREADIIPAFPVEAKAAMAAITTKIKPVSPGSQVKNTWPAVATGVKSSINADGSRTAVMRYTPDTYTKMAAKMDRKHTSWQVLVGVLHFLCYTNYFGKACIRYEDHSYRA